MWSLSSVPQCAAVAASAQQESCRDKGWRREHTYPRLPFVDSVDWNDGDFHQPLLASMVALVWGGSLEGGLCSLFPG